MRLCVWAGARRLLPVLVLLTVLHVNADQHQPRKRHYYIAAVEIDWKYSGNDTHRSGPTYKKVVFREYEEDFRQAKTHPSWLGLLGPTLRAEEGDTIVVTFRNMATGAHSIHPHGVAYGKQSEGANYFDNTSQKEKEDDVVHPNGEHVYYWEVTSEVSPQPADPTCLTYTYISHQRVVEDYNSGLIGALLICKPKSLDESGRQIGVHQEYVFLFGVFDEKESKYKPSDHASDDTVKYTINGYTKGSLPDVRVCAHASVSLHLLGMSSQPEVFSVHMHGQVLQQTGHKVSTVGLISGSTATASMVALYAGRWLLSSHTNKHMAAGMHGFVDVEKCGGFEAPLRRMTIKQKQQSTEWTYFIAAEEIVWDYAPTVQEHVDEDFKLQYLKQSPTRIGQKYKKVVYSQYINESFTERVDDKKRKNERGILGPVIRAQIRDVIKIVFKNMASRPYSIYPHGLTIEKSDEGVNYPAGGNHSHGVQPGETHTYVWRVVEEDEPLPGDPRCLTRMYHSAVDTTRDIASGLIGPILICKSQSLNVRNVQLKADKEQHAMFAVFDENKSWYLDHNIGRYTDRTKVNKEDSDFYKSNVMHTINGYVFEGGPLLGFCNGEVATWHVSSIGAQDYIQTATFYGHMFELNKRTEDFLSLYPMTGETITMNMANIGIWLLASLNSHETTKGMRVKFRDVECFRDSQYEYYDDKEFSEWKPPSLDELKKEEEIPEPLENVKETEGMDDYTDSFADELGLRSLKNQTKDSNVEQLDLSFLDYDVPGGDTNDTFTFTETKSYNDTSLPQPNTLNQTLFLNRTEVDGVNLTAVHLLNQSISENTTHIQNTSDASVFGNSTSKTENSTVFYSPSDLLKNDSATTNSSDSLAISDRDSDAVSDTNNTTIHNGTASSVAGNVSTEITNLTVTLQETTNLTVSLPGNVSSLLETERINDTLTGTNQTTLVPAEDSEERLTRGDVFSYSVPLSTSGSNSLHGAPDHQVSVINLSQSEDENNTATNRVNVSADATNHSPSVSADGAGDKPSDDGAVAELAHGLQTDSSENVTQILLETEPLQNGTVNIKHPDTSNASGEVRSGSRENITAVVGELNQTSSAEHSPNETVVPDNVSPSSGAVGSYEVLSASESSEEVFIYLKENNTEVIKTTSVKTQGHNWTYEGTHQVEPMDIPDYMLKYFEKETPQTTPTPKKKKKKVTFRQRPQRGEGMKTKKRKEYKPVIRSGLPNSLAFSPRGFNPAMTPRGSRPNAPQPFSDEEELINMPVVIGLPRPDFSDYELYVPGNEPDHLGLNEQDVREDEYEYVSFKDPYSSHEDIKNLQLDDNTKYYLKFSGPNVKLYFIAAEEVKWDYGGYGQRRQDKSIPNSRETKFTKVIFRSYVDSNFRTPDIRGEMEEHLGILGPVIKAEVGQSIMVVFKNNANRPYSIHPNGVSYAKQTEGLSYEDGSKYWYKLDNAIQPNHTFTYLWKVDINAGPQADDQDCRTWTYYSGVNPERDIHSGLIGPLLVCREGTLSRNLQNMREFMLLFKTFDESQSWYYETNRELIQKKLQRRTLGPNFKENLKFHSINGIIYNLKGLRMYTNQLARWHLINMGAPEDFQSVHFHGQTFLDKKIDSYRQAVYPLLPGGFATLDMYPSRPGLWQLETEVGFNQQKGMQTLFLVLDNECSRPLGLQSGSVKDDQITASVTRGSRYWEPHLARLNNQGKYNAWSTDQNSSWIQVDFQRPVVISQVATQGAKQMFQSQYVLKYFISYSTDRRKWIFYKGDSRDLWKAFPGNQEAYQTKTNTFFPPVIGRFIRLHPIEWYNKATVRMEFYGCELDGCSVPLGMESGLIEHRHITASSTASSWYSGPWTPSLARLNKQGTINAWQAKYNDMNQWLQVELPQVKKITGIVTQGAKSLGKELYVISYSLQYSNNGIHWTQYTDDEDFAFKTFSGNKNNNDHVKNYIYPPIFSRFIRIVPRNWMGSITMRIELLGCDFE
ncbi:coagulation factor V isoform X1 [Seriola aureovittata]|uniref:coagulation factor V isoform X1 n=1 Tax=Seriola aureovittata TaxID=2871759 RepID=UPI0024BDB3AA|nr:coagulation factor V isoform X1 [Seriola aureovittata]